MCVFEINRNVRKKKEKKNPKKRENMHGDKSFSFFVRFPDWRFFVFQKDFGIFHTRKTRRIRWTKIYCKTKSFIFLNIQKKKTNKMKHTIGIWLDVDDKEMTIMID